MAEKGEIRVAWVAVPIIVVLLLATGVGVLKATVDRQWTTTLRPGTVIEDVPVGGLTADAAVARLRERLEQPLRRPMTVTAERFESRTSPWDLGLRIDVEAVVAQAMERSRDGNVASRAWSRVVTSGTTHLPAKPQWVEGDLEGLLARAEEAVTDAPRDADLDLSSGFVRIVPAKAGRALDVEQSRRALVDGVMLRDGTVRLATTVTRPNDDDALSRVILVRTGENRLYLYDKGVVVKSWPVATGLAGYPTPTGVFRIVNKIENPTWYNPGSAWARGMPARIGPGRSNPLGTKALELDAPGILIHATSDRTSIGFNASHGCIRMTEEDEAELFGMVSPGTRVAIVEAGPPRPRGSGPPMADTPEQSAAVLF
jgi:lipoprotein-anchoring transpeptidase ErfK/SrfK